MTKRCRWHWPVLSVISIGYLALLACSATPTSPTPSSTSNAPAKPYGSLRIGTNFSLAITDPALSNFSAFQASIAPVFDSVVEINSEGQLTPGIAERWEIAPDGLSQTFNIRKGVRFHDGSDLTAADVKFSIERILGPDATHTDAAMWRPLIDGVDLKDEYTIILRLKKPQFELLKGFNDFGGSVAVVPKSYIEAKGLDYFRRNPVGSGPFKYVKGVLGSSVELEAIDTHWREVAKFKNVRIENVRDEAAKIAMLKTSELDMADIAPDSIAAIKAAGLRVFKFDGAAQYVVAVYYDQAHPKDYILGDVRVRKALSLSLNRKEIADQLFVGYAEPSVLFYGRPTAYYWDSNVLKPDPYEPEGAKRLLAEAGYPNGFNAKFWETGGGGIISTLNAAIGGYWRKIGARVDMVPIDFAALRTKYRPKMTSEVFDTLYTAGGGGGAFQFEKMELAYHSQKSGFNNAGNAKLDELIDKVPVTTDLGAKKRLALEAAVMAKNDYNLISVVDFYTTLALGSKVGELKPVKGVALLGASLQTITHAK